MGSNFFLDGKYTQQQIASLNKVKAKAENSNADTQAVNGDNTSIFNDINSYKQNSKTQTNNSDLFAYIEKTMGMDNFLNLLDADGDGKISESESSKLASYDKDNTLTSKDIDVFIKDIKSVNSAKSTSTNGNTTIEATYKTDSKGQLVKNTQVSKDAKTGEITAEYTLDDNGNIKTKNDKKTNRTTTFTYDSNNNLTSSETRLNNSEKTLYSQKTYTMVNGAPVAKETKVYINASTGEKILDKDGNPTYERFEYGYDSNGRQTTQKWYDKNGKLIADLTYTRDASGKVIGYKNAVDNSTVTYTFDSTGKRTGDKKTKTINGKEVEVRVRTFDANGKLAEETQKDENGKTTKKIKYNENGSFSSVTENGKTKIYDYDEYGFAKQVKEYNESDIGNDGKPNSGAEAISTTEYTDGVKTKTTKKNGDTTFYDGGKVKTEIQGDKAYVYTYNSDGTKVKATYNKSDIDENGNVKSGASPSSSVTIDKDGKEVKENDKTDGTDGNNNSSSSTSDPASTSSKPSDKDWSVYIGKESLSSKDISRLQGKSNVVIDAQNDGITKDTISKLRSSGTKVYSYLNVGSIEEYRDYYKKFRKQSFKPYENWDQERWMDVSNKDWQNFVVNTLAERILSKGCDGLWLDNLDVYEEKPSEKAYQGLVNILEGLNKKGVKIYVNGGNKFVSRLIKDGKANLVDGVMQEEVFTEIKDYDHDKFKKRKSQEYLDYLERCKKAGIEVSVLEYTKDKEYAEQIKKECIARGYQYNISGNVDLS